MCVCIPFITVVLTRARAQLLKRSETLEAEFNEVDKLGVAAEEERKWLAEEEEKRRLAEEAVNKPPVSPIVASSDPGLSLATTPPSAAEPLRGVSAYTIGSTPHSAHTATTSYVSPSTYSSGSSWGGFGGYYPRSSRSHGGSVAVSGHMRNGVWVQPHTRSSPGSEA